MLDEEYERTREYQAWLKKVNPQFEYPDEEFGQAYANEKKKRGDKNG